MLWATVETFLGRNNVLPTCAYDWINEIPGFIHLFHDLIIHFASCWIYKSHQFTRFPWNFWCFQLLEVPNWLPCMEMKLWNVLCKNFTNFQRTSPIQILGIDWSRIEKPWISEVIEDMLYKITLKTNKIIVGNITCDVCIMSTWLKKKRNC